MTSDTIAIEQWGNDHLGIIQSLWAHAMPNEELLIDDLETIVMPSPVDQCAIDATSELRLDLGPTHMWGTRDQQAAIIVAERHLGELRQGHIQLLVVHPNVQRKGHGEALITHVSNWAKKHDISMLQVGGAAPHYLYTGVDTRWLSAQCFFEKLGFTRTMVELDLFCGTRPPRHDLRSVTVSRVVSQSKIDALLKFAESEYPHWIPEYLRGVDHGTVMVAETSEGTVIGAGAHSVNRFGVLGPIGVSSSLQRGGIGVALMGALLQDLSVAGVDRAEIAWTSTVRFYERACGAWVGRAVQFYSKTL